MGSRRRRAADWCCGLIVMAAVLPTGAAAEDWPGSHGGPTGNVVAESFAGRQAGALWTSDVTIPLGGCVAVQSGAVFIIVTDPDTETARVYAFNRNTGAVSWVSDSFPNGDYGGNFACLAVDAAHVYFHHWGFVPGVPSVEPALVALDIATGDVDWDEPVSAFGNPIVDDGSVYLGGSSVTNPEGALFSFDAATGTPNWEVPAGHSGPVAGGGVVVQNKTDRGTGQTDGLTGRAASNGGVLWNDPLGIGGVMFDSPTEDPAIYYRAYPVLNSFPQRLVARNALTGAHLWNHDLGNGRSADNIVVDQDRVYVSTGNRLVALNRSTGNEIWRATTSTTVTDGVTNNLDSLMKFGGLLYASATAYDPATGAVVGPTSGIPGGFWHGQSAYADSTFFHLVPGTAANTFHLAARRDIAAPSLEITSLPANVQTKRTQPVMAWSASDGAGVGIDRIEVAFDGAAPTVLAAGATQFQPPSPLPDGPHTFEISAVDELGNANTQTRSITVDTSPEPIARLSASPVPALTRSNVALDASASADSDFEGSIARYEWDLDGDGVFERDGGAVPTTAVGYEQPFAGSVGVRVTNDSGGSSIARATLDVRPTPPSGFVGVSINGGTIATNDPDVTLSLVWPAFARTALISNDGGFGPSGGTQALGLAPTVPWTLATSGSDRLPKTVYLRFQGADSDDNSYTDDIILDQRPPEIAEAALVNGGAQGRAADRAALSRGKAKAYKVAVEAKDDNSGIAAVEVAKSKKGAPATLTLADFDEQGKRKLKDTVKIRAKFEPKLMRVIDSAGNASRWRKLA